ncbi:MAG: hypothetical protein SFT94_06670 [Pseudanabaenaceae cyanobacterium bins.68]|nr:hypothetical protein [Pseudanabaenaceae cyanobacterium bins.68]
MPNTYVLYHGNCYDGFGSAWAAWCALGDRAQYIPVQYGESPPALPPQAEVIISDFSYPRATLLQMRDRVAKLTLLDHHITAQEDLAGLDFAIFDLNRSGAMLAWQYWHPDQPIPSLVSYIQDRDLWRFDLPYSQEVFAALCSYPMEFEVWDHLEIDQLIEEGKIILRYQQHMVSLICDQAYFCEIAGYQVPVANATTAFADVAHQLCLRHPKAAFAAYYFDRKDGLRQWGLRSVGEFNVAQIAQQMGGGGHRNAAGFIQSLDRQTTVQSDRPKQPEKTAVLPDGDKHGDAACQPA